MSLHSNAVTDEDRRLVYESDFIDELEIDRDEIVDRKTFTRLEADDIRRLESMSPLFEAVAGDLVEEFYTHLRSHPESTAILESSSLPIDALKRSQRQYLAELGSGEYDRAYFARRARIGKLHDMLGLGPKLYLGAYSVYYDGLITAIADDTIETQHARLDEQTSESRAEGDVLQVSTAQEAVETAVERTVERICSVLKLMSLDQQVAMDTYIHSYTETVEDELERRNRTCESVQSSVEDLHDVSADVLERSDEIKRLGTQQASSMSEVAGEVSNLSATVEEIASNADEVSATSERAEDIATDTVATAEAAIETMERVEASSQTVSDDVEALREGVKRIDDIVDVINAIADQTNLLALNASIEAATAGEAGDGFAVVADEVKSLAEESQQEASTIEELIEQIQADTADTVESLEEATEEIATGVDLVEETTANLERIEETVTEAGAGIREVASATDDQATSTEAVASMADDALDRAHRVAELGDRIADQNERQVERIRQIGDEVEQLQSE